MKMSDYLKQTKSNDKPKQGRGRKESPRRRQEPSKYKSMLNDLFGTKGAYLLDINDEVLAKIPLSELDNALKDVKDVETIVIDGAIDEETVKICEKKKIKNIVSKSAKAKSDKVNIIIP